MRLDHIAIRAVNRWETAKFWINAFGYRLHEEFKPFDDDSVKCLVLLPSERSSSAIPFIMPLSCCEAELDLDTGQCPEHGSDTCAEYHIAPEVFISDGIPESIVGNWVAENGEGIHHLAYMVDDVEEAMKHWKANGWGEFLSEQPQTCPGIEQVFSKPFNILGGILIEFIKRNERGFCKENVAKLMNSTKDV
jgi:catechol 2,3-dioxygenase-like lactoylglutathione lyase family enzyme